MQGKNVPLAHSIARVISRAFPSVPVGPEARRYSRRPAFLGDLAYAVGMEHGGFLHQASFPPPRRLHPVTMGCSRGKTTDRDWERPAPRPASSCTIYFPRNE